MCPAQSFHFEDEQLAPVVLLCALRALEGRPLPVHLASQAYLPELAASEWQEAVFALKKVLNCLDGRSAKRWGLTKEQGAKFCRWRLAWLEMMNARPGLWPLQP